MEKRNLTFPMYLSWEHGIIEVVGEFEWSMDYVHPPREELQDGKGYVVNGGMVRIYSDKKPNTKTAATPYFWFDHYESEHEFAISFHTPAPYEVTAKKFSIDVLVDDSYMRILNETTGDEVLYNEQMINDMNVARSKFTPIVNEKDDYLKRLVKYIIIKKDVDINRYKSIMDTPYALTNMKSALCASTKMSVTNFLMWVELLQVDFSILVTDNGVDRVNPLHEGLLYRSTDNSIYQFANDRAKAMLVNSENKDLMTDLKNFETEILEKLPDHTTADDLDEEEEEE